MMIYSLELAWHGLRHHKGLAALMVIAIAVGIGASMTELTVWQVLSGDPIPARSAKLFYPQIEPRDLANAYPGEDPPGQLTWTDGMNLLQAAKARHQVLMTGGAVLVQPGERLDPFLQQARYATTDFFRIFGVPLKYGRGWSRDDDQLRSRVAVISQRLNQRMFGGRDSTGQAIELSGAEFRIAGVLGDWRPNPYFLDLNRRSYNQTEDVFMPLSTSQDLRLPHDGSTECWGNGGDSPEMDHHAPCAWLQLWVQLDHATEVRDYRRFLISYSEQQRREGRFMRPTQVRLLNVMQWLDYNQVVPADIRLQSWLALGFLLVCLINTTGLMLATFMRRSGELSVRRALGASRRMLFGQLMAESGVIGLLGGMGGLLLAWGGLWLVRQRPAQYASLAHLNAPMLLATVLLAMGATLLAGVLPAWRACHVAPAMQLKSQ